MGNSKTYPGPLQGANHNAARLFARVAQRNPRRTQEVGGTSLIIIIAVGVVIITLKKEIQKTPQAHRDKLFIVALNHVLDIAAFGTRVANSVL